MDQTNINFYNILYTELRKIRGSLKLVSQDSGRSREWVRWVLQEKYSDDDIIVSATKVLKLLKNQQKKKEEIARKNIQEAMS
jgi:hypothetical protein